MRYLLDSNVLSEPVRPRPAAEIVHHIKEHLTDIAVPAPVWHELQFGCFRMPPSKRRQALEQYLEHGIRRVFPILPYDEAAASRHATEQARLVVIGRTSQFVDGQIASIAQVNGLIVVTFNIKNFKLFENLEVLDWRDA